MGLRYEKSAIFREGMISDWARVPGSGLKPGFFPFERVGFFNLKTRVPGFPIF